MCGFAVSRNDKDKAEVALQDKVTLRVVREWVYVSSAIVV
jgi:hypothetical protein